MVEIHGHPLLASQWYKFAMTSWSSCWITVHLRNSQRARMRILSHDDEDSGSCSFAVHNKTVRPTVLPRSDGKRPSMPSSKTTTTTGESTTMKSHSTIMLTLPFFKTHRSMTAITTVLQVSNNNNKRALCFVSFSRVPKVWASLHVCGTASIDSFPILLPIK